MQSMFCVLCFMERIASLSVYVIQIESLRIKGVFFVWFMKLKLNLGCIDKIDLILFVRHRPLYDAV